MKKVLKLVPYPSYDIAGLSRWLEQNAENGSFLAAKPRFGIASFRRDQPERVKYRFVPATEKDYFGEHDESAAEIMKEFGWKYICKIGAFHLYVNKADAEEPFSDAYSASEAVDKAKREAVSSLYRILFIILYPIIINLTSSSIIPQFMIFPLWATVLYVLLIICATIATINEIVYFFRYKKAVFEGGEPKRVRAAYSQFLTFLLLILFVFSIVYTAVFLSSLDRKIPLDEFKGDLPFATLDDIFDGETLPVEQGLIERITGKPSPDNYVTENDYGYPAGRELDLHQHVESGENVFGLNVRYYETRTDAAARSVAKNLRKYFMLDAKEESDLFADAEKCMIREEDGGISILLARKNKVIYVSVYSDDMSPFPMTAEETAELYYKSIG
ncbi:MAG: DUF2812 domain-containing protein [Clostridia bacterium]|nr:DUF2812 domain-containing protein [Clostridia bacterium]